MSQITTTKVTTANGTNDLTISTGNSSGAEIVVGSDRDMSITANNIAVTNALMSNVRHDVLRVQDQSGNYNITIRSNETLTENRFLELFVGDANVTINALAQPGITGAFRVGLTANQSIPGDFSDQQILFNKTEYDEMGWYDLSTGRYTPQVPGYYVIHGKVRMLGGTVDNTGASWKPQKNGYGNPICDSSYLQLDASNSTITTVDVEGTSIVYMNGTTDYIEPWIYVGPFTTVRADSGSGLKVFCFFEGFRIGGGNAGTPGAALEVRLSTNQTATPGTWQRVDFDDVVRDSAGWFDDTTNYRYTPQEAGDYLVCVSVSGTTNSTHAIIAGVAKNGTRVVEGSYARNEGTALDQTSTVASVIPMNGTTDYIEGFAFASNTTIYTDDTATKMTITKLGGGASKLTELTDTPTTLVGQKGKTLVVNDEETALDFEFAGGGGSARGFFRVELSANQIASGNGATDLVEFDSVEFDTEGWYDNTTNFRYQPTEPGYYYVAVRAQTEAGTPHHFTPNFMITLNGNTTDAICEGNWIQVANTSGGLTVSGHRIAEQTHTPSGIVYLNGSTDYVDVYWYTAFYDQEIRQGSHFTGFKVGGGGGGLPIGYVSAYLSANQAVTPEAGTKIEYDTVLADSDGWYDNTTNYRYTPQVPGAYLVTACLTGGSNTTSILEVSVAKNGDTFKRSILTYSGGASGPFTAEVSAIVDMNGTTDYIEIFGRTPSPNFIRDDFSFFYTTRFQAVRIGSSTDNEIGVFGNSTVNAVVNSTALVFSNSTVTSSEGMRLLANGTVSAAATLDIDFSNYAAYRGIKIFLYNFLPVTDGAHFDMRISTDGSTYPSGATDYSYALYETYAGMGAASDAYYNDFDADRIRLLDTVDSFANGSGVDAEITIMDFSSTSHYTRVRYQTVFMLDSLAIATSDGVGVRQAVQDTQSVRFFFSTGNISSGDYAIYGLL